MGCRAKAFASESRLLDQMESPMNLAVQHDVSPQHGFAKENRTIGERVPTALFAKAENSRFSEAPPP
jgi:hypothetical protein